MLRPPRRDHILAAPLKAGVRILALWHSGQLARAGITTVEQLRKMGPVSAHVMAKRANANVSLDLLCAMAFRAVSRDDDVDGPHLVAVTDRRLEAPPREQQMNSSFQFIALPVEHFESLFSQSDTELQAVGARRMVVDEKAGFPCRVTLADADVGETVLLVSFTHHDVSSPYRASGPIFVRRNAATARPAVDEIPDMFRHRLLSVRGYDATAMMVVAEVVDGSELRDTIRRFFANASVSYLHIHNARPGCYNCRVVRA